jgi:hypothetical protein
MEKSKYIKTFESFINGTKHVNEASVELASANFEDKSLQKFLKANNIKAKQTEAESPGGSVYKYTASEDTLKKMIDKFWAVDAETAEEKEEWYSLIESSLNEGAITNAIRPALEGEVKEAVEALEKLLQSTDAIRDYKHANEIAYYIIDIINAAKAEERAEYED